jgi:3-methyladenine DNA glycosylase AlkD
MNTELNDVLFMLSTFKDENRVAIFKRHGDGKSNEIYGVKIPEIKRIAKSIKHNHKLAMELMATPVIEAKYLAMYIIDNDQIDTKIVTKWLEKEMDTTILFTVIPTIISQSKHRKEILDYLFANEQYHDVYYCAYAVTVSAFDDLDLKDVEEKLTRIPALIHSSANDLKYYMNSFVINVGTHVSSLHLTAKKVAEKIGEVDVDHGETGCKTPYAIEYIKKVESMGRVGKKRKAGPC